MTYFAKAALVIVRDQSGTDVYVYQGFPLPDGVAKGTLKGLLSEDLVTSDAADLFEEAVEPEKASESGVVRPPEAGPGSGAKAWVVYAESKGVELEADASRDDIIAAVTAAGF